MLCIDMASNEYSLKPFKDLWIVRPLSGPTNVGAFVSYSAKIYLCLCTLPGKCTFTSRAWNFENQELGPPEAANSSMIHTVKFAYKELIGTMKICSLLPGFLINV